MTPPPAELPIRFPLASGVCASTSGVPALLPIRLKCIVKGSVPTRKSALPPPAVLLAMIEVLMLTGPTSL